VPNPFAKSRWYHRLSNIFVSPQFRVLPLPRGFALLTVTGRRSGKPRRRPVRAIRRGDTLYAVAVLGERSDWLRNVRKHPSVRVKIGARTQSARAREIDDAAERESAAELYAREVVPYDYVDYASLHWGFPTRRKIQDAHRRWIEDGVMVAIDLEGDEE
jgi:deazaflavin-dependent oxidoreductase (nitroreductase family)